MLSGLLNFLCLFLYVFQPAECGLENIEIIFGPIREDVGFMFYPEANSLFKAKIDPRCGTPAYKRVPVWVYR